MSGIDEMVCRVGAEYKTHNGAGDAAQSCAKKLTTSKGEPHFVDYTEVNDGEGHSFPF